MGGLLLWACGGFSMISGKKLSKLAYALQQVSWIITLEE